MKLRSTLILSVAVLGLAFSACTSNEDTAAPAETEMNHDADMNHEEPMTAPADDSMMNEEEDTEETMPDSSMDNSTTEEVNRRPASATETEVQPATPEENSY